MAANETKPDQTRPSGVGNELGRCQSVAVDSNEVLLGQKYIVSRRALGQGAFGAVVIGRDAESGDNQKEYAIKKIPIAVMLRNPEEELQRHVKTEIGIMRIIRHPNIVRLEDAFYSDHNLYLVLELCKGGDFFNLISRDPVTGKGGGPLDPKRARKYFQQLIAGVEYCHERGIAHRDLKPENLLLDENMNLKICDFGLSTIKRAAARRVTQTQCGTPNYVSPEVLHKDGIYSDEYDPYKADIWTCGVLLYVFLTGCLPFDHTNLGLLYAMIKAAKYRWPAGVSVSAGAKKLVAAVLNPVPDERYDIPQIRADGWFKVGLVQGSVEAMSPTSVRDTVTQSDDINAFEFLAQMSQFSGLSGSGKQAYSVKFTSPIAASAFDPLLEDVLRTSFAAQIDSIEDENGHTIKQCLCEIQGESEQECWQLEFEYRLIKLLDEVSVVAWRLLDGDEVAFHNRLYVPLCATLGPDKIQGDLPELRSPESGQAPARAELL